MKWLLLFSIPAVLVAAGEIAPGNPWDLILQVSGVAAFVVLTIWLVPKLLDASKAKDEAFREELQSQREADAAQHKAMLGEMKAERESRRAGDSETAEALTGLRIHCARRSDEMADSGE
jgi:membrane protein implicated in regulation of membrane protease activity